MVKISEVIDEIDDKVLNEKTNNRIFYGLNNESLYCIVNYSNKRNPIIRNYEEIKFEREVVSDTMQNVCIDLFEGNVEGLFEEILKQVGINERLPFKDALDVFKFKSILYKHKKMVQLIFYNCEYVEKEKQRLLNEMFKINTYLFNIICLLMKDKNLPTYQTTKSYMLDDREDYWKFKVVDD